MVNKASIVATIGITVVALEAASVAGASLNIAAPRAEIKPTKDTG